MSRVALVHDWLFGMRRGRERVLEALLDVCPAADVFTLVHAPGSVSPRIEARLAHVPAPGQHPLAHRFYRWALPLLPIAAERLDLGGYHAGVLFEGDTPAAVADAVLRVESSEFQPDRLSEGARRFAPSRFRREMLRAVERVAPGLAGGPA